ncbi:hypothetical protein TNCV_3114881 [Trichonephila clavipes]|nr:hypothetical protein TNCV_3114881 [Trichonephila clavipes]
MPEVVEGWTTGLSRGCPGLTLDNACSPFISQSRSWNKLPIISPGKDYRSQSDQIEEMEQIKDVTRIHRLKGGVVDQTLMAPSPDLSVFIICSPSSQKVDERGRGRLLEEDGGEVCFFTMHTEENMQGDMHLHRGGSVLYLILFAVGAPVSALLEIIINVYLS